MGTKQFEHSNFYETADNYNLTGGTVASKGCSHCPKDNQQDCVVKFITVTEVCYLELYIL